MAIIPKLLTKTVATAGTRVEVTTSTTILPTSIYFEALATNTGYIYIGDSTVSSTVYFARLSPGQGFTFSSDGVGGSGRVGSIGFQLSAFYVDSSVSGEKVQVTYMNQIGA